jgi:hypothetical protein
VDADDADEPVPRLPRSRGFKLSRPQMVRIAITAVLLVMIVMIQKPCADTVSSFVTSFGDEGSAATPMPRPGTVDQPTGSDVGSAGDYETLPEHMTQADYQALVERQKAKQAAKRPGQEAGTLRSMTRGRAAAQGSGSAAPAGSGSAGRATPSPLTACRSRPRSPCRSS